MPRPTEGVVRKVTKGPEENLPISTVNFSPLDEQLDVETRDDLDEIPDSVLLATGDVVGGKTTIEVSTNGRKVWHTYEIRTRVLEGEDENNTFARVATVVNNRVLDLAYDLDERIADLSGARSPEVNSPHPYQ